MRALTRMVGGLVLVVAFAATAHGQSIGLKGGWAHPTIGGSDANNMSAINTLAGGGFVAINVLEPLVAVQAEALYVMKGAEATESGVTGKLKIGYLEVPLLAKLIFPMENERVKPNVFAGPYVGFKTSCNLKGTEGGISAEVSCADVEFPVKSTDFGLTFGGGLGFPLTARISGLLEARYDIGLTKIDDSTPQADAKNRAIMVFAGISIPVGPSARAEAIRAR